MNETLDDPSPSDPPELPPLSPGLTLQSPSRASPTPVAPLAPATAPPPAPLLPRFLSLKARMLRELASNLPRLLTLNATRREAIAQYLDRLAGQAAGPTAASGNLDAAGGLRRWVEGPRSPAQADALHCYFEEVALVALGQALVLKSWSDRGIRTWKEADVRDLNWAMNSALKPFVPPDRECWQVARQNIYSWYKPGVELQRETWDALNSWKFTSEDPSLLFLLFRNAREVRPQNSHPEGYDSRFYRALWEEMPQFGFSPATSPGPLRRAWIAFSPTLREGGLARAIPLGASPFVWISLESSPFLLFFAELMQLWWGPSVPPLWSLGTGLEVHTRDQLSLNWGSAKPSQFGKIAEMEACDVAVVLEEQSVRTHGRSTEAQLLREHIEALPYFKKLRAPGSSLGDLQACVALNKLRPGGLLWWAREEALSSQDGHEVLNFLLDRAKLVCEWDLSGIGHTLPGNLPLFPKHLYLFSREPVLEAKMDHHPPRLTLQGQIRSHVEVPLLIQDAFRSIHAPVEPRGQWKILLQKSPTPQREWAERWPDPTSHSTLLVLDRLRESSLPLASATTIRPTPDGDPARENRWSVPHGHKGFWIHSMMESEGRRLVAEPLPKEETQGSGYLILVPDEKWIAPLSRYLESPIVRTWLEHHAERRGGRWALKEQVIRYIPIPKSLLSILGLPNLSASGNALSPESSAALDSLFEQREKLKDEALKLLSRHGSASPSEGAQGESSLFRAALFARCSWELEGVQSGNTRFFSLVTSSGQIRWRQLLGMVPASECIPMPLHPEISMSGNLPLHMAIGRMERVRTPAPGIFLSTDAGFHLCVTSENPLLLDILWEQMEGIPTPTWSELVSYLKLPKRLEIAQATATDVLKLHGEQAKRMRELSEVLSTCTLL